MQIVYALDEAVRALSNGLLPDHTAAPVLAFWTPSFPELVIVLIVALLLFGKRLPDVARSLGKGIVEFKKGVKGIEDEVDQAQYREPPRYAHRPLEGGESSESTSSTSDGQDESPRG